MRLASINTALIFKRSLALQGFMSLIAILKTLIPKRPLIFQGFMAISLGFLKP